MSSISEQTRWPAEWEPQSGLLLTWPHPGTDWRAHLAEVEEVFADIIRHASERQTVIIACRDEAHRTHVRSVLNAQGVRRDHYRLYIAPSNDSWARDHGPIAVLRNGKPRLLDFTFNGWGQKYPAELDNRITSILREAKAFGETPLERVEFVLEGGSIETDGTGTVITTASCLLSPRRNPGLVKRQVEATLARHLGATRVLWLEHGQLAGDDTDGHIDTLVRFVNADTLVHVACRDPRNPNYEPLGRMADELRALVTRDGKPYRLIPLPTPVIIADDGHYLPASYANFLIIDGAVLVPVYGVPEDGKALAIFNECFVDRKIIGINCRPLLEQHGSLHCVTMHFPPGVIT